MRRTVRSSAAAALLACVLLVAVSGCAQASNGNSTGPGAGTGQVDGAASPASYSGVTGTTRISFDDSFVSVLEQASISTAASGNASLSQGVLQLPVTGGSLTFNRAAGASLTVEGNLEHQGSGLILKDNAKSVRVIDLALDDLQDGGVLSGDVLVDGRTVATGMELFTLDGGTSSPIGSGESSTSVLDGSTVTVAAPLSAVLSTAFGSDAVAAGSQLGTATFAVQRG